MPKAQYFNKIKLTTSDDSEYHITLQEISGQLYVGDNLVLTSSTNSETLTSESQSNGTNKILLSDLPTIDPELSGQIWNDSGVLKISLIDTVLPSIETASNITSRTGDPEGTIFFGSDTDDLYIYIGSTWKKFESQ